MRNVYDVTKILGFKHVPTSIVVRSKSPPTTHTHIHQTHHQNLFYVFMFSFCYCVLHYTSLILRLDENSARIHHAFMTKREEEY